MYQINQLQKKADVLSWLLDTKDFESKVHRLSDYGGSIGVIVNTM